LAWDSFEFRVKVPKTSRLPYSRRTPLLIPTDELNF